MSLEENPEFEVTARDRFNITFRTRVIFPVKCMVHLLARRPETQEESDIQVMVRSAFVLPDDRVEYTARIESAPYGFPEWQGPLVLRDHEVAEVKVAAPSVDQRRMRRLNRTFQVMSKDLKHFKALSADISETGIRLMAGEPLAVGKTLDLTMDFDDSAMPHLKCKAEVVWCRPKDAKYWWVGLKFTYMSPENQQIALDYIRYWDQLAKRRPSTTGELALPPGLER